MESEIKQTSVSIIQTFTNGSWKSEITQTIDESGRVHVRRKISNGTELKEETEVVI